MSESKHTPGPWAFRFITERDAGHTEYLKITANRGETVVAWADADNEPNARLIAAAPELLAALQGCFENSCRRSETRQKWTNEDQISHELIKAAINKATGGDRS